MAVTDDFNRSDSASLGSGWTNITGTCQIVSNAARPSTTFARCITRRAESAFPDDQYAQAKIEVTTGGDPCQGGLVARAADSSNYYYCILGTASIELWKRVAGTETFLGDWANAFTASTFYTVKLEAIGTAIKVYVDTGGGLTQRISVTDSALTSGYPGLFFSPNGSAGYGDADDFESTDPAGQYASPDSDVSNAGSWTTSTLYTKVDEPTADDGDFISSPSAPSNAACVLGLSDVTDPASSSAHKVRVRYRKADSGSHQMDLAYRLLQGATEIAAWTATDIGTSFTTDEQTLSGGEADSITDYTDLRVELSANKVTSAPAAPTYVAAGTQQQGTGAINVSLPAGIQADDILLLFVESANETITLSTASGFAEITNSPQGTGTAAGTAATRLAVFWKRATGSNSNPVVADPGNHAVGRIIAIRGCKTSGDPWNVDPAGDVAATGSTSVTIPGVTTSVDNCMIVVAVSNPTDTSTAQTSGWTNSNLSSLTERIDQNVSNGNGGGFGVATGILATAGATGDTTATLATSGVQGRICIALEPVANIDTTADVSWVQFECPEATGGAFSLSADTGSYTLTGNAVTFTIARTLPTAAGSYAITGNAAGLLRSYRLTAETGSYSVTGNEAGLAASRTLAVNTGSYTLTGNAAGTYRGYLITANAGSYTLTGNAASLLRGLSLTANAGSYAITGNAATLTYGSVQTLTAETGTYSLIGNGAGLRVARTMPAGTGSYSLTGNTSGLYKGFLLAANAGSYSITGNAIAFSRTYRLTAATGSYSITGNSATLGSAVNLVAETGSYVITGSAAGLRYARTMPAGVGTYSLTGNAAGLLRGLRLSANAGSFTLTGNAASLLRSSRLTAQTGSYTLTGNTAALSRTYRLTAATGSYALTGNSATLGNAASLSANTGTYAVTGNDAGLRVTRRVSAGTGTITVTGNAAALLRGFRVVANTGSYSLTGNTANFLRTFALSAGTGSYTLTGNAAGLLFGRKIACNAGSYTLTGNAATLNRGRTISAEAGSYTLTGNAAGVTAGRSMSASLGTYVLTGNTIALTLLSSDPVQRRYYLTAPFPVNTLTASFAPPSLTGKYQHPTLTAAAED